MFFVMAIRYCVDCSLWI